MNNRALRELKQSRRELFVLFDQPNALPLPQKSYEYAEWKIATVNVDYHIEVDDHYYSVPYQLKGEKLHVRFTAYPWRSSKGPPGGLSCPKLCAPSAHHGQRTYAARPSEVFGMESDRFIRWSEKTGPHTARLVKTIIESRAHPEQGYRSCLGILRLDKHYPKQRLENAAARALRFSNLSLRALRKILENGLDRLEEKDSSPHSRIAGPRQYPWRPVLPLTQKFKWH